MNTSNEELKSRVDIACGYFSKNHDECECIDEKFQQPRIIDAVVRHLTGCPACERKQMRGCGIDQTFIELIPIQLCPPSVRI